MNNKVVTFDAIVVGSGISGGWAAKELTEKGLKVLMLDRGKPLEHISGYETAGKHPWDFDHRGRLTVDQIQQHPYLKRDKVYQEGNEKYWFKDSDAPYTEINRFDWFRPDIVGGKSIMWGRHSYRWSDLDFEANAKEGVAVDWPVRYADLAPWYSYVEKFVGISGEKLGLPQLPDSEFQPAMELNCVEKHLREKIKPLNRVLTMGRLANMTQPNAVQKALGRGSCQYRHLCNRGCPYGAYFSTQSATLPAAQKTKRLTLLSRAIATEVLYDAQKQRAIGVRVVNADTMETTDYFAKVIFVNASAMASNALLLHSKSTRFPTGLGNDNGLLGTHIMDHHFRIGASGSAEGLGFDDKYYFGRRPGGIYLPRYRNLGTEKRDYLRGFGYQGGAARAGWQRMVAELGVGADFKALATEPGPWRMGLAAFGECLPYADNKLWLDPNKKDKWGLPTVVFDVTFRDNEMKMRRDMKKDAVEMLEVAGLKDIQTVDEKPGPGMAIHEMGGARMGRDPKTSLLNAFNQLHACPNVFVTDGACMTSSSCVNPSLTYMALTARAADHAVRELKARRL